MESITATIGQKCANQETLAPNIKLGGATEKKVLDLCSLSSSLTRHPDIGPQTVKKRFLEAGHNFVSRITFFWLK
jgi:hypothetical protein